MDEYNKILAEFKYLESNKESLAQIARGYGFTDEDIEKDDSNTGNRYEVFKASKQVGEYKIIIKVETRDNYRSFGEDDEEIVN